MKDRNFIQKTATIFSLTIIFVLIIGLTTAQPVGTGTLSPVSSERGTNPTAGTLAIEGGNVTNLGDLYSQSITPKWAGFFGNVSGDITLEDASGNVFYNWTTADPDGEIFATRDSSPTWAGIACATSGQVGTEGDELLLDSGSDNITNTFCEACGNHSAFGVGAESFTDDQCTFRTNAYNSSGSQTENWDNVLLYEGTNIVYTTIMNQNSNGFDGDSWDFHLLVAENSSTSVLTTYFFYIEI